MGSNPTKSMSDSEATGRFLDVDEVASRKLMPIEGYEKKPLVSLDEAVKPLIDLIPKIENKASLAKRYSDKEITQCLSVDEHAAIKLYTMEWGTAKESLYIQLNQTLRNEDRDELKPWFLYLKLLLTALSKLPSKEGNIFRGVKSDMRNEYSKGTRVIWWGCSSCTSNMEVMKLDKFLGSKGKRTLFIIEAHSAKDIKPFSQFKTENEFLLPPARQLLVLSCLPQPDGLVVIHLQEMPSRLINLLDQDNLSQPEGHAASGGITDEDRYAKPWRRPIRGTEHSLDRSSRWLSREAEQVGGSRRPGYDINQLNQPRGLYVDDDSNIYIADAMNHRIVIWTPNAKQGLVIAGGKGKGDAKNQLDTPTDVIFDKRFNRLLICDSGNRRIVSWPLDGEDSGEILLANISCEGLTMDKDGYVYISDSEKCEVRKWKLDYLKQSTIVAGGNGCGDDLNQLSSPTYLFLDDDNTLYISDSRNHRIMKWVDGAATGEIVAGGYGAGDGLDQLHDPQGIIVDEMGTVYIADRRNNRVMTYPRDSREGIILLTDDDQLSVPHGLSFDCDGHLFVSQWRAGRINKYSLVNQ